MYFEAGALGNTVEMSGDKEHTGCSVLAFSFQTTL